MKNNSSKILKKSPKTFFKALGEDILFTLLLCAIIYVVLYLVTLIVGYPMKWILGEKLLQPTWTSVFEALSYVLTLVALLFIPKIAGKIFNLLKKRKGKFAKFLLKDPLGFAKKDTRDSLGLTGLPTWTDIGLAPIAFIASLLASQILLSIFSLIFPWFNAAETQNLGYATTIFGFDRLLAFITLCVVAPIAEELIFRGWLYGRQRAKTGAFLTIFFNAVFFGVMHGQWNVALTVGAMGATACLLREITGTVYSGILLHILKNSIAFVLLFIYGL